MSDPLDKMRARASDDAFRYLTWGDRKRAANKGAPGAPAGDRTLVRQLPPQAKVGSLYIPEVGLQRPFTGILIAAGNSAADKLYDAGWEIGDVVAYAKFAGLKESWTRMLGGESGCKHDMHRIKVEVDECAGQVCATCGGLEVTEPLIVVMADDLIWSEELQGRYESGTVRRLRGKTKDGKTQFFTERVGNYVSTWEINPEETGS